MGKVRISEFSDEKEIQITWEFIYEYTYCDRCGSFDIGITSLIPKKISKYIDWFLVILLFLTTIIIGIISEKFVYALSFGSNINIYICIL